MDEVGRAAVLRYPASVRCQPPLDPSFIEFRSTTLASVVLDYMGLYCEASWSPGWGHIYVCYHFDF